MYRALAVTAARSGISPDDREGSAVLARKTRVSLESTPEGGLRVVADGEDVTAAIRSAEASDGASRISVHPEVRTELVRWQREMASRGGVVMEGRDIGTVVLAKAEAKIFLTASPEERARRRWRELQDRGETPALEAVLREILERDARDRGRDVAPLRPAPDAVVLDCTALDLPSQVSGVRRVVDALLKMREEGGG
jgi:cytidylate kinase